MNDIVASTNEEIDTNAFGAELEPKMLLSQHDPVEQQVLTPTYYIYNNVIDSNQ